MFCETLSCPIGTRLFIYVLPWRAQTHDVFSKCQAGAVSPDTHLPGQLLRPAWATGCRGTARLCCGAGTQQKHNQCQAQPKDIAFKEAEENKMDSVQSLRHMFFPYFVLPHFYTTFLFVSCFILNLSKNWTRLHWFEVVPKLPNYLWFLPGQEFVITKGGRAAWKEWEKSAITNYKKSYWIRVSYLETLKTVSKPELDSCVITDSCFNNN